MPLTKTFWWAAVCLVLMVLGALAPWAKVFGVTIDGTDDGKDGWIVVGAAAVAAILLLLYVRVRSRFVLAIPLLAGCAAAATAGYDISDINGIASGAPRGLVSTEWGIYLALAGSISLIVASLALMLETRRRAPESETTARSSA